MNCFLRPAVIRLCALITGFVLVAHWAGCMAYYVGSLAKPGEPNWLVEGFPGRDLSEVSVREKYTRFLYWSLVTLTTVGYGTMHATFSCSRVPVATTVSSFSIPIRFVSA
jgi:hypothetical protein